jgi:DNA-binding MarR family transcriptional regulator
MNLRLIFGIHRTTHRIGLFIQRHAPDLNQAEAHLLCHLLESGDSTIAQLHAAFAHKRSTLTSVLDRLSARGLTTREPNPQDRRSFIVRLTRQGTAKAARIHQRLESLEADALRGVDRKTVDAFSSVLDQVERAAGVNADTDGRARS